MRLYILVVVVFISSCMYEDNGQARDTNETQFLLMIDKGYSINNTDINKQIVVNPRSITNVCIYTNTINTTVKDVITHIYAMYRHTLGINVQIKFVRNLVTCPDSSNVFIKLHDGYKRSDINSEWAYILNLKHLTYRKIKAYNQLAFGITRLKKDKAISLVVINQLSNYQYENEMMDNLTSVINQEIFQTFFFGRDIVRKKRKASSILHESTYTSSKISNNISSESFKKHWKYNPKGLCGLDIWYSLLSTQYIKENTFFSLTSKYKKEFEKNLGSIKQSALEISMESNFSKLFDPRCSGKNTGINTKIGIE